MVRESPSGCRTPAPLGRGAVSNRATINSFCYTRKTWQTRPHYLIWPGEPPLPINLHGIPITIKDNTIIVTPKTGGVTTIKINNS